MAIILSGTCAAAATDRNVNVRVSPLSLAAGLVSSDVDLAVGKKMTVGPTFSMLKASTLFTELSGFNIGARVNLNLSGDAMTDSWLLGPSVAYTSVKVSALGESASAGKLAVGALVAYQWVWNSGINVNAGLGGSWYSGDDTLTTESGSTISIPFYNGIKPQAELTLGYAF
jgi:hypothetical protein